MGMQEHTTERKNGIKLPWLNDKVVDNYADLLTCLASVPREKRQGVATSRDLPRPNEQASGNVASVEPVEPRLFALIIGIDDYIKGTKLRGSRADALAVKKYLRTALNVPSNRITILLDQDASRNAIIGAFESLRVNDDIQLGDPILIFYAGHGAEIVDGDAKETRKIQSIIPQNHDGITVHPIPDRTIGGLLAEIHKVKGDNITVILDCCHSGGMCRDNDNGQFLVRAAEIHKSYRLPDDLDSGLTELARATQPATFASGAFNTHVLLAACSDTELAKESGGRGRFTTALLNLLNVTPLERLSYSEILTLMEKIDGQNPQCQGNNQKRRFFDGKAPSRVSHVYKVHKDEKTQQYKLKIGSIHGLSNGAKFDIYTQSDAMSNPEAVPVCTTTAVHVTDFEATLAPISQHITFPEGLNDAWALLKAAGNILEPKLFIAWDVRLLPVFDALVHLRANTQNPYQVNFALAEDRAGACLEVELDNDGKLGFIILDEKITKHGLHRLACKIEPSFDAAVQVLRTAAHYFYQLHLSKYNRGVEERVKIQFFQLKQPTDAFSYRTAIEPNLMKNGIVSLEIYDYQEGDEPVYYGVEVFNNTGRDLYPHIFSFDSSGFAIKSYYGNGIQEAGGYKADPPLRSKHSLKIGYGDGGADAFDFYIPDDQDVDVSFLKFIFPTKSVNLEDVECDSPFLDDSRATRVAELRADVDDWGSILVPIALKRKRR